jgi:DNA-binding response OmpR family regulator
LGGRDRSCYDYDIIPLDLDLPDMSGFEVLRNLRVSKVKAPILILMGLDTVEDKVRGLGFGADDYIIIPSERTCRAHPRNRAAFKGARRIGHPNRKR